MILGPQYNQWLALLSNDQKCLAVLIDPEKTTVEMVPELLRRLTEQTTHFFVGGSTVPPDAAHDLVLAIKQWSSKPVWLFPGKHDQVTSAADALLFLSLLSGDNPEYLIGQQTKAAISVKACGIEVIPTAYLLIDGGRPSTVARVSQTSPLPITPILPIVERALAGMFMGAHCVYLEAGSGASSPVSGDIIKAVKNTLDIPVIVGGGIRTEQQLNQAYAAGADLIVMGTVFEKTGKAL